MTTHSTSPPHGPPRLVKGRASSGQAKPRVLAVGAHPDDVEFGMAGTLALLREAGYEPHIMTMTKGDCGTAGLEPDEIMGIRAQEAADAAALIGATYHPGLVRDLEVSYRMDLLRPATARIREINPHIMLVPSYDDYMEEHSETARVIVTAAFCKGMRNLFSDPARDPVCGDTYIYHAQPHGLRDRMNRYCPPELFVRIDSVIDVKENMLRCHKSQKEWLDVSQGMDAYLTTMRNLSSRVAGWTGKRSWKYAEGFRRHCHLGFAAEEKDPLREVLAKYVYASPAYKRLLKEPRAQ